jgi:hypothetical protein
MMIRSLTSPNPKFGAAAFLVLLYALLLPSPGYGYIEQIDPNATNPLTQSLTLLLAVAATGATFLRRQTVAVIGRLADRIYRRKQFHLAALVERGTLAAHQRRHATHLGGEFGDLDVVPPNWTPVAGRKHFGQTQHGEDGFPAHVRMQYTTQGQLHSFNIPSTGLAPFGEEMGQ